MYKFERTPRKEPSRVVDSTTVTFTIDHDDADLEEMLTTFEDFLKGCGFNFTGHVDIIFED